MIRPALDWDLKKEFEEMVRLKIGETEKFKIETEREKSFH